jgi:UV DNA damage repair endonuclease
MIYSLVAFVGIGVALLAALAWLSFSAMRRAPHADLGQRPQRETRHISYLPQIKQALSQTDHEYLSARGPTGLANRVRKERRRIALNYLTALRTDFEKLQHMARVVAVMSPEVAVAQELQGVRLSVEFSVRYRIIYFRLLSDIAPMSAINNLSNLISALTVRMETAISSLGESAVLAAELRSPHNGMNPG